jgi:hypothetical protein
VIGADAAHTAGRAITEAAEQLAPLFTKRGYAFLFLFRRGQGLSADQAPFIQDVLQREETAQGKEARRHLQFVLLTTDQLDDVMAALSFLKTAPGIPPGILRWLGIRSVGNSRCWQRNATEAYAPLSASRPPPIPGQTRPNCAKSCLRRSAGQPPPL